MGQDRAASCRPGQRGITLVEIMVGMMVLTVAFVSMSTVFSMISKGIMVNKTKTLAINLAQEKIESLKNLSYYRLLVSTAVQHGDPNFAEMMYYDKGTTRSYYPEETLTVGDVTYKRRAFVELLRQVGNDFVGYPTVDWTGNDTGIKRVTVYVVWQEGDDWKKVELRNLKNNPNRAQLEYEFSGTVSSANSNVPLMGVLVDTEQNPSFYDFTDESGIYSFKVQPGSYTLRVNATGYFTSISSPLNVNANAEGGLRKNFSLVRKATGTAIGHAFLRNHLMITQVVPSYTQGGINQEFIELYNPTNSEVVIASRSTVGGPFDMFYVTVTWIDNANAEPPNGGSRYILGCPPDTPHGGFMYFRSTAASWNNTTSTISIPARSYFLIANVSTVTYGGGLWKRTADAYYRNNVDGDVNKIDNTGKGGIRVTGVGGYNFNGRVDWHDGFAWDAAGTATTLTRTKENYVYAADAAADTFFYRQVGSQAGVGHDHWTSCGAGTCLFPFRNSANHMAFCHDTDNNAAAGPHSTQDGDWYSMLMTIASVYDFKAALFNSDVSTPPATGHAAQGAAIVANDGTSSVGYVQRVGSFTLTNIATGTWNVTFSTGAYTRYLSSMTVVSFPPNTSTNAIHNGTGPTWEIAGAPVIALTSSTTYGYISGTVRDILQRPINTVTVAASGTPSVTTNAQGRYRMNVEPTTDALLVTANKTSYSMESSVVASVALGQEVTGVDFTLVDAGRIKGFITTNGAASGYLPGIPVVATDLASTTVVGSAISGADGFYYIESISTGQYILSAQLESGETAVPGVIVHTVTVTPQIGWSTFTISNAFGDFNGLVASGSSTAPITTGVLIVASTVPITSPNPPDADAALRTGSILYYAASSDARGRYELPVRGGVGYYIYGWYTHEVDVLTSTTTKKTPSGLPITVPAGVSMSQDIIW